MLFTNAILKNIKQMISNQDRNKLSDIFNDLNLAKFLVSAGWPLFKSKHILLSANFLFIHGSEGCLNKVSKLLHLNGNLTKWSKNNVEPNFPVETATFEI